MILLVAFGFVAGAGTALSPCMLPILPAVLTAGSTGGRRRPLGIVVGLGVSFTFAAVALVYVIAALGLPNDLLRILAIAVLMAFGLSLAIKPIGDRFEAWLSRFGRGPRSSSGDGFGSGVLLGCSLGILYVPCAGPILAGVITLSASQALTIGRLGVALAYGVGLSAATYVVLLGGRRLTRRLSLQSGRMQTAMGLLMVLVAVAMVANLDSRFRTYVATSLPSVLYNPTKGIENTAVVKKGLSSVRGAKTKEQRGAAEVASGSALPRLGAAPAFTGNQRWFNTPGDRPLTLAGLRGRVVLVDFWTYTCINCLRTFPYVKAWDRRYRGKGLTIVGVHTPEFPFEKKASNVARAIADNGLRYPVAQDSDYATWDAYGNQFWPAKYLIDARGQVRYTHFGEGDYGTTEKAIRSLLAEAGATRLGGPARARVQRASRGLSTPETYLGAGRADRFANGSIDPGVHVYRAPAELPTDHLAYGGRWRIAVEDATALKDASVDVAFGARRVFLVLGSPGKPRSMRVLLDGRPIPDRLAGADVHGGVARIGPQRLYRLVDLAGAERHRLTLRPEAGIAGFAFTFG